MSPLKKSQTVHIAGFLFLLILFAVAGGCSENFKPQPAPPFELVDLKGRQFTLSDFKGKVVFLEFWATWCPPCVASIPSLEKIADEYRGKPVEIISLSVDQDVDSVKEFLSMHKIKNRVAMVGDSGVDVKYGVQGIPAFFIIDKQGRVTALWSGYSPRLPQHWRSELNRLLEQK